MVAGLLLVFIPLAGDYITASVLGGAKGNMAGALVASQFLAAQNWALGSAMAVVLIFTILASHRDRRGRRPRGAHGDAQGPGDRCRCHRRRQRSPRRPEPRYDAPPSKPHRSRGRRFDLVSWGLGVWTVLVIVFLFIPIGFVVAHSFNSGNAFLVWQGFSTEWYRQPLRQRPARAGDPQLVQGRGRQHADRRRPRRDGGRRTRRDAAAGGTTPSWRSCS